MSDFTLSSRTCGNSRACRNIRYSVIGDHDIGAITGHRLPHAVSVYFLPDQTFAKGAVERLQKATKRNVDGNGVERG